MASFEDRDYLWKEDLQLIKKFGLKFRGRNQWPMFRSYRPGYVPWFLTKKERPYFPRMLAVIDHRSIMGLDFHIFEISSDTSEFRNHFLGFLEKHGALPKEILVGNDETLQIIAPIASLLKINVKSDSELLAMEEFNHAMFDFFRA